MKYMTHRGVAMMIHHALRKSQSSNGHIPVGTVEDIDELGEGESLLIPLHQFQLSPVDPTQDELREYRHINGKLYFKVWKGA